MNSFYSDDISDELDNYYREVNVQLANLTSLMVDMTVQVDGAHSSAIGTLATMGNACLLGPPGGGKTTVLKRLTLESTTNNLLPPTFFVPLRELTAEGRRPHIAEVVQRHALGAPSKSLALQITNGHPALVILDGLDELSPSQLCEFGRALGSWRDEWPQCKWIVATRNHTGAEVPDDLTRAYLLPLNREQTHELLSRRLGDEQLSESKIEDRLSALPESIGNNPLMLDLFSRLSDEVTLPHSNLFELYETAMDYFLRSWDKERGVGSHETPVSVNSVRQILSKLALHATGTYEIKVSAEVFHAIVESEVDDESAPVVISNLLRSSLLFRTDSGEFIFAHKSFLDYFAVLGLRHSSPEQIADVLASIDSPQYYEFMIDSGVDQKPILESLLNKGMLTEASRFLNSARPDDKELRVWFVQSFANHLGVEQPITVASTRDENTGSEFSRLLKQTLAESDPNEKGPLLERTIEQLFATIFETVTTNRLTDFGEIDLICAPRELDAFWIRWPSDYFIECKNQSDRSPVADINEFLGKAALCTARLAFFVSINGFTSFALDSIKRTWRLPGIPDVVWITGKDLIDLSGSGQSPVKFLKEMCRRSNLGR